MKYGAVLVLLCGCKQIFGFETPQPSSDADAAFDAAVTDMIVDLPIDGAPITVTFQQGVDYDGTRDTFIEDASGSNATSPLLRWKFDARYALLAFDVFNPTGIPAGATIQSAQLFVTLTQNNATGDLVEIVGSWPETVTFDTFGPTAGVTAEDLGAVVAPFPIVDGTSSMDVTSSLVAWAANPSLNQGWIFLANNGSAGDSQMRSSEDSVPESRPRLVVTYVP